MISNIFGCIPLLGMTMCNLVFLGAGDEYLHGPKWTSKSRFWQLAQVAQHIGHSTIHTGTQITLFFYVGYNNNNNLFTLLYSILWFFNVCCHMCHSCKLAGR